MILAILFALEEKQNTFIIELYLPWTKYIFIIHSQYNINWYINAKVSYTAMVNMPTMGMDKPQQMKDIEKCNDSLHTAQKQAELHCSV